MTSWVRRLRARLRYRHFDDDLRRELEVHRSMAERELRASGEPVDGVHRVAARQMGNVTLARETARGVWIAPRLESIWSDARHAVRRLDTQRGFTLAATGMLALGIGITTAMFTVVDALVLRPAPFRDPARLALLLMGNDRGVRTNAVAPAVLFAWRGLAAFEAVESAVPGSALLEVGDTVIARGIATVTPGVFEMLGGVRPLQGQLFGATEGGRGQADRVLVSETVWRAQYGADPAFVGTSIIVDGERVAVLGILPADFRFPSADTVLWRPTDLRGRPDERARPYVRFAAGVPPEEAEQIATLAARAADPRQGDQRAWAAPLAGLSDVYSTRALPLLAGGVVLVFVVLCANVCSLLLARLAARRRESGMRAALGASRGRLMQQALVESAVLRALGVAIGAGLAWAFVSIARGLLPAPLLLQTLNPLDFDGRALGASSIAGAVAVVAVGLLPAWLATRVDAGESLRVADRGGTEARGPRVLTRILLIV